MRFQQAAPYAGKGQKDLPSRVKALASLGESITARNPDHPHLFDRRAVIAAEQRLGVVWKGAHSVHGAGYFRGNEPVGAHGSDIC